MERAWNPLLQRSRANTVFLTWEWQRSWWDCFGEEAQLCIVAVRDGSELVGLAPLHSLPSREGQRALQFVGGVDVSDYLDVVVIGDSREAAVYSALWRFLTEDHSHAWDVLDLHNIRASSPTLARLPALAETSGEIEVTLDIEDACPVITLPSTWDDYLWLLKKKQRHEVRRKIRKAQQEASVRWYFVGDATSLDGDVQDFISLHRKSGVDKKAFMDERMQRFFHAIARATLRRGWLRLAFLVVNDVKAASMLCFDYEDAFLVYNSGYDPDLYRSLSTGIVLLAYCIRDAIEKGRKVFDFLRGEEDYKYRFGGLRTEIHNLRVSRRGSNHHV